MRQLNLLQIKRPSLVFPSLWRNGATISTVQNKNRRFFGSLWPSGLLDPLTSMLLSGLIAVFLVRDLANQIEAARQRTQTSIMIQTATGPHEFSIEVMRTEPELEKGLMDRTSLAENAGMLFDFQAEKPVLIWMKNTTIPLDMIFLSRTGLILSHPLIFPEQERIEKSLSLTQPLRIF